MDISLKRNVQGTDITSERNVLGTDITSGQGPDYCLQDGDHTDGHYITPFTEQLTRTFEVLVLAQINC